MSVTIIGHRGNGAGPDENTLASCRRALQHGADVIELDVQLIDGELMLAHPPRQPKASLNDVLPRLKCPVVLHLKRRHLNRRHDRAALTKLADVRYRPGLTVSSFWPGTLRHAKRNYPKLQTAFLTRWLGWDYRFAKSLGVTELHAWHWTLTNHAIRKAKRPVTAFPPRRPTARLATGLLRGVITDKVSAWTTSAAPSRRRK